MKDIEYTNNIYGILWVKLKRQKGMRTISLSTRQKRIAEIVRQDGPITGEHIAERLNVTRAALRSDLAILVMGGILDARPKVGYFYTGKNTVADSRRSFGIGLGLCKSIVELHGGTLTLTDNVPHGCIFTFT